MRHINKTAIYFIASVAVLLVLGSVWYVARYREEQAVSGQTQSQADAVAAAELSNSAGLSPQAAAAAQRTASMPPANLYTDTTYGFSLQYPYGLKVGSADSSDQSTTILAQNVADHIGFQIYITPWDGAAVTADMVARDLPQIGLHDAQQVMVGGTAALAFLASDPNFGSSWQVWFVYQNNLYQISTYSSQQVLLQKILATWTFTTAS